MKNIKTYDIFLYEKQSNESFMDFMDFSNNTKKEDNLNIVDLFMKIEKNEKITKDDIELYKNHFKEECMNYTFLEKIIMDACNFQDCEIIKEIIKYSDVNHQIKKANNGQYMYANGEMLDIKGLTPILINAIMSDDIINEYKILNMLTDAGANWYVLDDNNNTILDYTKNKDIYEDFAEFQKFQKEISKIKKTKDFNL